MKLNTFAVFTICLTACSGPAEIGVPQTFAPSAQREANEREAAQIADFKLISTFPSTSLVVTAGPDEMSIAEEFHDAFDAPRAAWTMPQPPPMGAAPLDVAEWVAITVVAGGNSASELEGYVSPDCLGELTRATSGQSSAFNSAMVIGSSIEVAGGSAIAEVSIDLEPSSTLEPQRLRFDLVLVEMSSGWQVVGISIATR